MRSGNIFMLITAIFLLSKPAHTHGQKRDYAELMAETVMKIWKDSLVMEPGKPVKWAYDQGVVLEGIEGLWRKTADARYFNYIQKSMDYFVNEDGSIRNYKKEDFNIDNIKNGRSLMLLYKVTGKAKYLKAVTLLREQLRAHPRTAEGGFWHKKIYPYQMWLDGLYMGEPFYTEAAALFHEDTAYNDIARQFTLMERHSRDDKSGLLYHGYDESRQQRWSDKATGRSPHFWGRAMGWYGMALVDVLDHFPKQHPKRDSLVAILNRMAVAVQKYQDARSGVWYQILDKPNEKGNYLESSASSMFVYTLAKGVRLGVLPLSFLGVAQKGYNGLIKEFIETDRNGQTNLKGTVSVAGLGGNPYRDGSYAYYISEKVVSNDPKGVGAFLLAGNEMELAALPKPGLAKTVTLDCFFNNETIKAPTGFTEPYHYRWQERDNNGFYFFGEAFKRLAVTTNDLPESPTAANLKQSDIYIIVDPDTRKETPNPNFIQAEHISEITNWVKAGGVLVLMGNDSGNAEFEHFNTLAASFGIQFNENSKNRVTGADFQKGKIQIGKDSGIFRKAKQVYIKELSTLSVKTPAEVIVKHNGDNIIAVARVGKGTVFAVGDPWLYNEYTDGRKLPAEFENYQAAKDLAEWLVQQVPAKRL